MTMEAAMISKVIRSREEPCEIICRYEIDVEHDVMRIWRQGHLVVEEPLDMMILRKLEMMVIA